MTQPNLPMIKITILLKKHPTHEAYYLTHEAHYLTHEAHYLTHEANYLIHEAHYLTNEAHYLIHAAHYLKVLCLNKCCHKNYFEFFNG